MKLRKILSIFCASIMLLSFTACSDETSEANESEAIEEYVVTTPDPEAIMKVTNDKIVTEFAEEAVDFPDRELRCYLPKGFQESEYEGEYLHKSYPKDVSSINHVITDTKEDPTKQTKEEYIASLKADLKDLYGSDINVDITQYDKIVVDGRPGLWIMYNYDYRGEHYYVLQVKLFTGKQVDEMLYFEAPGSKWMDKFVESAESLTYVDPEKDAVNE